jgi:hypothetical protein
MVTPVQYLRMRADSQAVTVILLCRGCCCGTRAKHPGLDHAAQEDAVISAAGSVSGVDVRVVDCLDECARSNVAVIRRADRAPKERDTWLGGLVSERATNAFAAWIAQGAPDDLPPALAGLRFRHLPPRRRRGR